MQRSFYETQIVYEISISTNMRKNLFLSHTWREDVLGRDTHARVRELKVHLEKVGWNVWFDEDDMCLNLDASMVRGIEEADVFVVCFTREYATQVNSASFNMRKRSNCLKEFTYANARNKLMICVMLEPFESWPAGVVTMYVANMLYIDGSGDDMTGVAKHMSLMLSRHSIVPTPKARMLFRNVFKISALRRRNAKRILIKI